MGIHTMFLRKATFLRLVERYWGHKFVETGVDLLEAEFVEDCEGSFGGKRRAIEVGGQEMGAKGEVRASKRKQRSPRNKKNYDEDTKFW